MLEIHSSVTLTEKLIGVEMRVKYSHTESILLHLITGSVACCMIECDAAGDRACLDLLVDITG